MEYVLYSSRYCIFYDISSDLSPSPPLISRIHTPIHLLHRIYQAWKGDDAYLIRDGSDTEVESDMLTYLLNRGTLAVCLDATMWASYVTGTMFNCGNIATADINHCVQVVGVTYNAHHDIGYYKVRNSWGSNWGDAGYIYLAFGQVGNLTSHQTFTISYLLATLKK